MAERIEIARDIAAPPDVGGTLARLAAAVDG